MSLGKAVDQMMKPVPTTKRGMAWRTVGLLFPWWVMCIAVEIAKLARRALRL